MGARTTTDPPDWPAWVQTWILPYLWETTLWPVAFALLGHVVIVVAPLMLIAIRSRSPGAAVGLGLFGLLSATSIRFELKYRRRPGGVSLVVGLTWLASVGLAWVADHYGVF